MLTCYGLASSHRSIEPLNHQAMGIQTRNADTTRSRLKNSGQLTTFRVVIEYFTDIVTDPGGHACRPGKLATFKLVMKNITNTVTDHGGIHLQAHREAQAMLRSRDDEARAMKAEHNSATGTVQRLQSDLASLRGQAGLQQPAELLLPSQQSTGVGPVTSTRVGKQTCRAAELLLPGEASPGDEPATSIQIFTSKQTCRAPFCSKCHACSRPSH